MPGRLARQHQDGIHNFHLIKILTLHLFVSIVNNYTSVFVANMFLIKSNLKSFITNIFSYV